MLACMSCTLLALQLASTSAVSSSLNGLIYFGLISNDTKGGFQVLYRPASTSNGNKPVRVNIALANQKSPFHSSTPLLGLELCQRMTYPDKYFDVKLSWDNNGGYFYGTQNTSDAVVGTCLAYQILPSANSYKNCLQCVYLLNQVEYCILDSQPEDKHISCSTVLNENGVSISGYELSSSAPCCSENNLKYSDYFGLLVGSISLMLVILLVCFIEWISKSSCYLNRSVNKDKNCHNPLIKENEERTV
ncbi:uncharacterized protein [Watersipora subatra]|uniref:uncharacterized protein isoform X1 n=1 Tax=Watersipora subatra TaxID=2589382 RepID=UPI00355AE939